MKDMVYNKQPMDRLVCGDIGFGKTEVSRSSMYSYYIDFGMIVHLDTHNEEELIKNVGCNACHVSGSGEWKAGSYAGSN